MKHTKRILAILLLLVLGVSLCACGGNTYTVTVKYLDENGNEIAEPYVYTGKAGERYDVSERTELVPLGYTKQRVEGATVGRLDAEIIIVVSCDKESSAASMTYDEYFSETRPFEMVHKLFNYYPTEHSWIQRDGRYVYDAEGNILFDGGEPATGLYHNKYKQYPEQEDYVEVTLDALSPYGFCVSEELAFFTSFDTLYMIYRADGEARELFTIDNPEPYIRMLSHIIPLSTTEIFYCVYSNLDDPSFNDLGGLGTEDMPTLYYYVYDFLENLSYSLGNSAQNLINLDLSDASGAYGMHTSVYFEWDVERRIENIRAAYEAVKTEK